MKRKKAIFFLFCLVLILGVCVCVCVCVRACVRGRGGALLSLIGMFTNLSNANIKPAVKNRLTGKDPDAGKE